MLIDITILILSIDTDCRKSLTDRNYNGTMNVTKSGHRCRKWSLNTPLPAGEPPSAYHGETLNYCRTPDGDTETKPWCYTTSQDARWEVCNVPFCGEYSFLQNNFINGIKCSFYTEN